jgi:hypothetical protein
MASRMLPAASRAMIDRPASSVEIPSAVSTVRNRSTMSRAGIILKSKR